jgi:hypothetical protein
MGASCPSSRDPRCRKRSSGLPVRSLCPRSGVATRNCSGSSVDIAARQSTWHRRRYCNSSNVTCTNSRASGSATMSACWLCAATSDCAAPLLVASMLGHPHPTAWCTASTRSWAKRLASHTAASLGGRRSEDPRCAACRTRRRRWTAVHRAQPASLENLIQRPSRPRRHLHSFDMTSAQFDRR